ncbi:MAG: ADP-forming succinate--CoA ligase subunit beta [Thermodesulfobacteriota bacterium]|nr:ADP-forming succinate--CoA ligase subunit beta [Thermodesulfobacteriota bacterium]
MKIHEYQAKKIMGFYQIPIPKGDVAKTGEEAREVASKIGGNRYVVKAQVHAGGRGKGGGIKTADSPSEVERVAGAMLGSKLITPQTGAEGKVVHKVLVEETVSIAQEMYLGITVDRARECSVIIISKEGGMEIEELAKRAPEKIVKEWVDPGVGLRPFQISRISFALELDAPLKKPITQLIGNLYRLFLEKDCSLAEINPLVVTNEGQVIALDAKFNFDDNALYRHKEIVEMRDALEEEPLEVEASRYNLNYIKLDGNVGCMVNGAGLAMATMDVIKLAGGMPANFLDVGGGATVEMVKNGLKILVSDPNVKAILVNIFGGILRCDTLAKGLIEATSEIELKVPVVIRMEGTNVEAGRKLLNESGLKLIVAETMKEAAGKVVASIH